MNGDEYSRISKAREEWIASRKENDQLVTGLARYYNSEDHKVDINSEEDLYFDLNRILDIHAEVDFQNEMFAHAGFKHPTRKYDQEDSIIITCLQAERCIMELLRSMKKNAVRDSIFPPQVPVVA